MATDSEIKEKGFKALMNELGIHDMEKIYFPYHKRILLIIQNGKEIYLKIKILKT
ncbi:MAG: hypothetical protein R3A12_02075 [Ignavibacteria bacterium]